MYNNLSKEELIKIIYEKDKILSHKDRVSLLGESIEEIADEFKKPLLSVSSSAKNLQIKKVLSLLDDKMLEDELHTIISNTDYLIETINNLSNFCKDIRYESVINLKSTIQKAISISKNNFGSKDIKIVEKLDDNSFFKGVENELMQVLLNIINNAIDILMHNPPNQRNIVVSLGQLDEYNVISIEDSGGGIKEANLDKIFDQYFTTKGDNGSGVGLFICKQIITNKYQGEISVHNTINGACFTIKLPRYIFKEKPCN